MRARRKVFAKTFAEYHYCFLLFLTDKTGKHLNVNREAFDPFSDSLVMLECEYRSRYEYGALLAVRYAFECRSYRNLRLAETNVAAKQSVHRMSLLHIVLDFIYAAELVVCFVKFKSSFKVALHINVR